MTTPEPIAAITARLQAQRKMTLPDRFKPRPNFAHLDDPGLLARLTATVEGRDDAAEVQEPVTVKRKRIHKPTLASVAKQAMKAGLEVARYEVDPATGKIGVVLGKPEVMTFEHRAVDASEWN